ncbi:MAG TPA: MFS transporter [Cyclobacteriaceae bacterium]|nr:MFS transporter [Cyclobacteriaceae bacterium]
MEKKPTFKPFTQYQKFIIAIIALIQFTVVLDFMVISPLGPILMKSLSINPTQFGLVVAVYAFSAGISGILAAGVADKYDRKKFLLVFYTGFVLGTLLCGLAPTYELLLAARIVTGLFGGVIGAIGMAIITDIFEIDQRGRVFGFTQMGFSASQVLGLPISLILADKWGWNSPFYLIVILATIMGVIMVAKMQPVTKHLELQKGNTTNPLIHLLTTLKKKRYQTGFIATALLPLGAFMLMPFGSAFSVDNLGVDESQLWVIFGATGIASMIAFPLIGRLSDKYNKLTIFGIGSVWGIVMVIVHTNWGQIPLWLVLTSNVLMFVGIMGRIVPSTILISAIPEMKDRGAFMSINSSLQQLMGGVASIIAGFIVVQRTPNSPLENVDVIGYVVAAISVVSFYVMYRVYNIVKSQLPTPGKGSAVKKEEPVLVPE